MNRILLLSLLSMSIFSVHASSVTQVNRYATVSNKPSLAQLNPLLAVQQMHFPHDISTIGEAIEKWLQYSGFTLVPPSQQSKSLQALLQNKLPEIDRNLGPLTIKDGLEVLVGQHLFKVIENPIRREVNLQLRTSSSEGRKA